MNLIGKKQHDDYQSNQEEDGEMEWVEHNAIEKLINITSIVKPMTHESMPNSVDQD
jgi:hypothetical protein